MGYYDEAFIFVRRGITYSIKCCSVTNPAFFMKDICDFVHLGLSVNQLFKPNGLFLGSSQNLPQLKTLHLVQCQV